jgi:hypothetical protein
MALLVYRLNQLHETAGAVPAWVIGHISPEFFFAMLPRNPHSREDVPDRRRSTAEEVQRLMAGAHFAGMQFQRSKILSRVPSLPKAPEILLVDEVLAEFQKARTAIHGRGS